MGLSKIFGKKNKSSTESLRETATPIKSAASESNVSKKTLVRYVVDKYGMPHVVTDSEKI